MTILSVNRSNPNVCSVHGGGIYMYIFLSPLQHFQLLLQTFVLSRFEPSLVFLSQISAQAIVRPKFDTLHLWRCILKSHAFLLCLSVLMVGSQGSAYTLI